MLLASLDCLHRVTPFKSFRFPQPEREVCDRNAAFYFRRCHRQTCQERRSHEERYFWPRRAVLEGTCVQKNSSRRIAFHWYVPGQTRSTNVIVNICPRSSFKHLKLKQHCGIHAVTKSAELRGSRIVPRRACRRFPADFPSSFFWGCSECEMCSDVGGCFFFLCSPRDETCSFDAARRINRRSKKRCRKNNFPIPPSRCQLRPLRIAQVADHGADAAALARRSRSAEFCSIPFFSARLPLGTTVRVEVTKAWHNSRQPFRSAPAFKMPGGHEQRSHHCQALARQRGSSDRLTLANGQKITSLH